MKKREFYWVDFEKKTSVFCEFSQIFKISKYEKIFSGKIALDRIIAPAII